MRTVLFSRLILTVKRLGVSRYDSMMLMVEQQPHVDTFGMEELRFALYMEPNMEPNAPIRFMEQGFLSTGGRTTFRRSAKEGVVIEAARRETKLECYDG